MDERKSVRRSGPVPILEIHTNQGWSIVTGSRSVEIRLAQTHSVMAKLTRLAVL